MLLVKAALCDLLKTEKKTTFKPPITVKSNKAYNP